MQVAVVRDPELPALEPKLVDAAIKHAQEEYRLRFDAEPPRFEVVNELSVTGFLGAYALPVDPRCKPLYAARYRGGGKAELQRERERARSFLKRWSLDALKGFVAEADREAIKSHDDIYTYYLEHYSQTVEAMKGLSTDQGTPLVDPARSTKRSFAAWTCALRRQSDYDVVLSNAFILADLMSEPHPHAVFGKAKVGGIASQSPDREALGGQALLATTFGIDTKLPQFRELGDEAPTFDQRAKILGAYLLAHEVAHAVFGIPDVFDHPKGCLMTSRPGATYLDGLKELEAHPTPCPKCRPYVESKKLFDQGKAKLAAGEARRANTLFTRSLKKLPKHFHGGRKKRVSEILLAASKANFEMGKVKRAKKYGQLAMKLDPSSQRAVEHWESLEAIPGRQQTALVASRTSSTSTSAR